VRSGALYVKVKLTIGFALIAMLVKLPLLLSFRRFSPGCRRGDDTQVASNGLGVAREGWGCHPEHDLEGIGFPIRSCSEEASREKCRTK
jgi:hypothetical protein